VVTVNLPPVQRLLCSFACTLGRGEFYSGSPVKCFAIG
jgi:hypothetical protein